MLTPEGPKVSEHNPGRGDPEWAGAVPRRSSALAGHVEEAATGRLETPVTFRDDACVTVVLATEGYPTEPRTGDVISGLDAAAALDDVIVFHAGTKATEDGIVTAGGRVLAVTALGTD